MGSAEVEVIAPGNHPSGGIEMANFDPGMALWWVARRHRFVVHISVIDGVVGVDCDRRVRASRLRYGTRDQKFSPGSTGVGTESTALIRAALRDRQPGSTVRGHMQVTMKPFAVATKTGIIHQHAAAVTGTKVIATLAEGSANRKCLPAIIDCLTLIGRCLKRIRYRRATRNRI